MIWTLGFLGGLLELVARGDLMRRMGWMLMSMMMIAIRNEADAFLDLNL